MRCAAALILLACAVASCRSAADGHVVRGWITDVEPHDIAHAESIQLRTESGQVMRLKVADSVQFPPSHLREHMLFAEPVTVTYEDNPRGSVATSVTD